MPHHTTEPPVPREGHDIGAVVTGAGHGIGRAIAQMLAARGARIVVQDLDLEAAREVADLVGGLAVGGDVSQADDVRHLLDASRDHLGRIDAFYSNAGRGGGAESLSADASTWDHMWHVNVMSHVLIAQGLEQDWSDHGGRFVVTASAAGLLTAVGKAPYAVTKHAAVALAEWLRMTHADDGVIVQCLCPLGVRTRMTESDSPLRGVMVHDGFLEPEDVAESVREAESDGRFLILPHPQVAEYYRRRATDTDGWLAAMGRLARRAAPERDHQEAHG